MDSEGGGLRFGVAASAFAHLDEDNDGSSQMQAQVDGVLKWRGLSVNTALYSAWVQPDGPVTDQQFDRMGFHLQFGYMLSEHVQPAVRGAVVAPKGADNDIQELALALNILLHGHKLKWQSDFTATNTDDILAARTRFLLRSQLQWSW